MAKKTSKKRVHSGKGEGRAAPKVVRRQTSKKKGGSKGTTAGSAAMAGAMFASLEWCHGMLGALLKDWPADKLTYQSSPTDGHALWTIGHLATGYSWFAGLLDGQTAELPETYNALFGYGSKPTGDASAYPSRAEVQAVHEKAWQRVLDAAKKLKDADLAKPPAMDSHGLAKSKLEVIRLICWHDGWHQGQVSSLRKAIGLPGVM
jgi:hypothetical protein